MADATEPPYAASDKAKDVREKRKVTNSEVNRRNLEQHILTRNIGKAANYFAANQNMFNYRTFRQVKGDGAQLINKLRGVDNLDVFYKIKSSVLSLMRPKIKIYKVNYEDFALAEDGTPDQGKITSLPQPCYREFKFSDNFGIERLTSVQDYLKYESTKSSWRSVGLKSFSVEQDGRTHGAIEQNIKCNLSLTFKSLKDIQASPPGEPTVGGLKYVDLITYTPARINFQTDTYNSKHYEIKVLLGYTAPSEEQLRSLNLSEKDLQAVRNIEKLNTMVSLTLYNYDLKIKENGSVELNATYRGRLESVVGSNQVNIFQNTHRIGRLGAKDISKKVNENHNVSGVHKLLSVLTSVSLGLREASCKDEKCKSRTVLRSLVEEDPFFGDMFKLAFPNFGPTHGIVSDGDKLKVHGDGSNLFKFFKETENVGILQDKIKQRIGDYKKDIFSSFVDQLIEGNTDPKNPNKTRLFCINTGADEVTKAMAVTVVKDLPGTAGISGPGEQALEEESRRVRQAREAGSPTVAVAKGEIGVKIDRCHRMPVDVEALSKEANQEASAALEAESGAQESTSKEPGDAAAKSSTVDFSGENYKFYFVYLGDIIELACKNAGLGKLDLKSGEAIRNEGFSVFDEDSYFDERKTGLNYPLKNARMLIGPLEYRDVKGDLKTINLSQFPISFNLFRSWFIKKVVRSNSLYMSLGGFLQTLMKDLVMPSLSDNMPKKSKAPRTRENFISFTLPGKHDSEGTEERITCQQSIGPFKELLPMRQVLDTNSTLFQEEYLSVLKKAAVSSESMIKTSYDYFLIHVSTNKDITKRRGAPDEDLRDGIYHFNIGSDMGLLKSMNFKKEQIPGLAEARSMEAEEQGTTSLDQLKFPYHTSLVLVGTSLFTPGMFYYVNPSTAGLGRVEDSTTLAHKMNLGGYHMIMTVKTTVTPQKFETSVTGYQQGHGGK